MAKAGPDVSGENQGGFASDGSSIWGFSHMHDSGTGGSPSLGNFPIFPQAGCPNDDINACNYTQWERLIPRVNGTASARPGYFAITLESQIHAEMTVTNRTALYRFTFPEIPTTSNTTLSPLILVELSDLPQTRSDGNITVDINNGRITGSGRFMPSFGIGTYKSYFCADFDGAELKDAGVFANSRAGRTKSLKVASEGIENSPSERPAGGWVQFKKPDKNNQIQVRVGMSFISEAQACSNAEKEIPNNDFDAVVDAAAQAWKDKFSVITVEAGGVSEVLLTTFWSGVYRSMISPQDYTGENPLWQSDEPYYDSFYCIWDSFRSIHPLITLLDPHSQTLMVRSLLDIYKHEGYLPDCRMSFCKGFTQGGSNADIVIVDAYLKNITESIDWTVAYEALVRDAEVEAPNWDVEGRGGLESWKNLGYIPTENLDLLGVGTETRSISRTVEYAYNDFVIATLAQALGHTDDYAKYLTRSGNWHNMFNPDTRSLLVNGTDTGFTGFLQPRYMNGTWGTQDPIFCSPLLDFTACYLNPSGGETYEGPVWLYTFFAPADMATLVGVLGGRAAFLARLDWLHDSGILYMGDEQAFLTVFLYHYAGRPARSAQRLHGYIPALFNDTVNGIPGNDDSGAMGSFVALAMLGVFPNAGQDVYFITPPFFEAVAIRNGQTGKTATIRNVNFDPSGVNVFVQSATLDGRPYTRNWLQHSFFLEGGTLELTLGPSESKWGTREEDVPPSLGPFGRANETGTGGGDTVARRWGMPKFDMPFRGSW
ncbi:glycosyl hydrolase family 92-domain-containing protein [Massariosphaeria phaeospora]|uniref:Glycosyl hydrolase family 92-domain-containing protein n=1 Tax=Massariosphaeria phaeospora TaxID=100035 RepID=A0A7C8IEN3_9PLEO|nr:glycosyl hydrolase family 92-domain-containing protein [Massariosphaeria phaeospora]